MCKERKKNLQLTNRNKICSVRTALRDDEKKNVFQELLLTEFNVLALTFTLAHFHFLQNRSLQVLFFHVLFYCAKKGMRERAKMLHVWRLHLAGALSGIRLWFQGYKKCVRIKRPKLSTSIISHNLQYRA